MSSTIMCIEKARSLCPRIMMNRRLVQLLCSQMRYNSNISAAPAATDVPAATAAPAATDVPAATAAPAATVAPAVTVAPGATAPGIITASDWPMLLSEEQRIRCMTKLRSLPAFKRPPTMLHNKREKLSAAVLIALCLERETNEISLLYTRRSRQLRSHSMQISFPGGKRDEADSSFTHCALRETEEEIGLPRQRIEIWGESNPIQLPRTSTIVPVVGVIEDFHVSQLKLNPDEVELAFTIPLNSLLAPTAVRHTQFRSGYSGPVFAVSPYRIWGITGYLTYIFLRCLLPSHMLPDTLKKNLKFIRPYKIAPKLTHHHVEPTKDDQKLK